jgi:hypothetical protein
VAGAALVGFALSRTVGCFGFIEGGFQPAPQARLSVLTEVAILALLAVGSWTEHALIKRRSRFPGAYCHFVMIRTRRWAAIVGVGLMLTVAAASAASADTTRRDVDGAPGSTIKVGIKPLDAMKRRAGPRSP